MSAPSDPVPLATNAPPLPAKHKSKTPWIVLAASLGVSVCAVCSISGIGVYYYKFAVPGANGAKIMGKWECKAFSTVIEFKTDGTGASNFPGQKEFKWRVDGNVVVIDTRGLAWVKEAEKRSGMGGVGYEERRRFSRDGDVLTFMPDGQAPAFLSRVFLKID